MKRALRISFLLLAVSWLASACYENILYHSFQTVPRSGWGKSDTLFFNVPVSDSLHLLHLYAEVRNLNNFAYRELYLFVSYAQDSAVWKTDTISFPLANKDGRWEGDGTGNLYQSKQSFGAIYPRHSGSLTIKVSHGMKDEVLEGIQDVGICIEK